MGDTTNKYSGKAKKMAGKAVGDREIEAKGKVQEEVGKVEGEFDQ